MSGFKAITVNTSPEVEPHIYAEDDAAIFQTIFGKDGVSTIGQQCAATVISNNKVRVADGVICVGGHFGRIPYGEYVDCEIQNGKTGVNRNDIIVAKFQTTGTGGIDTFTCEVIQGTAGSTASDPAITKNELYSGGTVREFPLYRVKLEGLSIVSVDKLFNIIPTNAELLEKVSQLNSELSNTALTVTNIGNDLRKKILPAIGFESDIYSALGNIRDFNIGTIGRWWYCNANNGTADLPSGEVWGFGLQLKYSVLKIVIFISGTSGHIYHSVANGDTFGEWFKH